MGKTLKYGDFDFGPTRTHVKGYVRGGAVKSALLDDSATPMRQKRDKHFLASQPSPLQSLQSSSNPTSPPTTSTGGIAATMGREALRLPSKAAARRMVPVAPTEPLIGMKKGGTPKVEKVMHEFKTGTLHSGSKAGPVVKSRQQAVAIALSEAKKAKK